MKILIVEDSKFTQKVLKGQISACFPNAEFFSANDGEAGFDTYKEIHPNVVITDLLMPAATGFQLIENIRKTDTETHIIVVTADVQETVKTELESLGILAFINKPFNQKKAEKVCTILKEFYHD